MHAERNKFGHLLREYATHAAIGGAILMLTGFAPEQWLARLGDRLRVPGGLWHLWGAGIDVRVIPIAAGVGLIAGDRLLRHRPAHAAPAAAKPPDPAAAARAGSAIASDAPRPPDKPSIAVLAFANLSGDPEQEYFSDGMADDIITELSRSRALFVIARNSSFTYKGHAVDVKQVARDLGVRYVLEGSVRRDGERIRVNAQLIDAETGNNVWAERYDRAVTDVFAVQDEISHAVVIAIHPAVADAELQRAMRRPSENLSAWEAYQRGRGLMMKLDRADNERARGFLQRAIELDPNFSAAYVALSVTVTRDALVGDVHRVSEWLQRAEALARQAVAADPGDADAQAALANALTLQGETEAGVAQAQRAVAINPNSALAVRILGSNLLFAGRPAEARKALQDSLRLSPRDPSTYIALLQLAMCFYQEHDYAAAERAAREAVVAQPENLLPYRWLAAALGQLGRTEEARAALRQAVTIAPEAFDFYVRSRPPWIQPGFHTHLLEGLRKAGWQG